MHCYAELIKLAKAELNNYHGPKITIMDNQNNDFSMFIVYWYHNTITHHALSLMQSKNHFYKLHIKLYLTGIVHTTISQHT